MEEAKDGFVLDCSVTMAWCFDDEAMPYTCPKQGQGARSLQPAGRCGWFNSDQFTAYGSGTRLIRARQYDRRYFACHIQVLNARPCANGPVECDGHAMHVHAPPHAQGPPVLKA